MVAGALAFPLVLDTAGTASADSGYNEQGSYADPDGADTYSVSSYTDDEPAATSPTSDDVTDIDDTTSALDIGLMGFGGPYLTSGMTNDVANVDDVAVVDPTSASTACRFFGC